MMDDTTLRDYALRQIKACERLMNESREFLLLSSTRDEKNYWRWQMKHWANRKAHYHSSWLGM